MFIDNFGRIVYRYSGLLVWPLLFFGLIVRLLRPSLTGHQKYVLAVAYGLPLLAVSVVCLARPYMIQQHLLESYAKNPNVAKWRLVKGFVLSAGYIPSLRLCGVLALIMVALIAYALFR